MEVAQISHCGSLQPSHHPSDLDDDVCKKTQKLSLDSNPTRTSLKTVLDLDCGNKLAPNAVELLISVFIRLAKKFHLNQIFSSEDGLQICCSAEGKARQVLFGSAILQVQHSISIVQERTIKAQLGWYHPFNLSANSEIPLDTQIHLYQKRERFVHLFNGSWQYLLEKIKPCLSKSDDSNDGVPDELFGVVVHVKHSKCPKLLNLKPILKPSKSPVERSYGKNIQVRFSESDIICDVPVKKEDREARMGVDGSCIFPDGQLKPLRSAKTGEFIWRDENKAVSEVSKVANSTSTTDHSFINPIKQPAGTLAIVRSKTLIRRDSPKRYRSQ